jgi:hypothetical protein
MFIFFCLPKRKRAKRKGHHGQSHSANLGYRPAAQIAQMAVLSVAPLPLWYILLAFYNKIIIS